MHTQKQTPQELFNKDFSYAWEYLHEVLKPIELDVVKELAVKANLHIQEIIEINGYTVEQEIIETLNLKKIKSKQIFVKLFELGIYGKFRVAKTDNPNHYVWILNPKLLFLGEVSSDLNNIFEGTVLSIEFRKRWKAFQKQKYGKLYSN